MFILTIAYNDPETIRKCLRELAKTKLESNLLDDQGEGISYEYEFLPRQPWVNMADFLHFNEDGHTLKKPKY